MNEKATEYVKVLFQHISETDLYDTFFSFIDLLQKMHPESIARDVYN